MNILHSAPVGRRRITAGFAVLAMIVLGALSCAQGAYAETRPPVLIPNRISDEAYSTRVLIEGYGLAIEGLATEWKAEYSTSCAGPWTEVNKAEYSAAEIRIYIGVEEEFIVNRGGIGDGVHWLRHLAPNTSYCARFTAKNADGEATPAIIPFKTLPVAKPEVEERGEISANERLQYTGSASATTAGFKAEIEGNGAETTYAFEYAPAEAGGGRPAETSGAWKQFTSGAAGVITVAEEHAEVAASLTGLTPETTYYVRLKMHNGAGEAVQTTYVSADGISGHESFTTLTAKPVTEAAGPGKVRNVTQASAHIKGIVEPHGSETSWRFEYATSVLGPWSAIPSPEGAGTISRAQAEAVPYGESFEFGVTLSGLSIATKYYVRLFAENAAGEGEVCHGVSATVNAICEPISSATFVGERGEGLGVVETLGAPSATTFAVHGLQGESLRLLGAVNPHNTPTSAEQRVTVEGAPTGGTFTLTFNGHTTAPLAYNAPANEGGGPGSVEETLGLHGVSVEGSAGGPYTILFYEPKGVSEPQIEANGSGLTPSGSVKVETLLKGGESAEAHYHFQYVSQTSFTEHGWSDAAMTPEALVSPGDGQEFVHASLPALEAGETYHYRLVVNSSIAGIGLIEAPEETLRAPSFTVEAAPSPCPNEAFRTGLSAHLADCRAYELLTPIDKGGSQEPFTYNIELGSMVQVGEDGEHALLEARGVSWGAGPGAGGTPYLFSREVGKGWKMTAGSPQPATGVANLEPQLYSADVSQGAFESKSEPSDLSRSEEIEFKVGPLGGPYTTVVSVPRAQQPSTTEGWVAANASFSKLVFETPDHSLLGEPTGTRGGDDLYEYTTQGGLRQLNVSGEPAETIGSCGADIAVGSEGGGTRSSLHTVSADGSRVFFYASAPHECSVSNLYVRVNGSETFDIGPYKFVGANEQGTRLLLEDGTGELEGYDSETGTLEPQSSGEKASASELALLGIPDRAEPNGDEAFYHPRYAYWSGGGGTGTVDNGEGEVVQADEDGQVYRYDRVEHLVECVSCASSYDPSPKQPAFLESAFGQRLHGAFPLLSTTSADGRFAFFTTPSALVPQDVDGEIHISSEKEFTDVKSTTSLSSDVYEWRAAGVDGCGHVQGCLSLITDGRGGYLNILLGSAEEGREVFIYTRSKLLPQDVDTAGDIYAVRVDGGFAPPPPRPTECEGDACSAPPPAPNDATPSSLTFNGIGNALQTPSAKPVIGSKKAKSSKPKKGKKSRKAKHKARKSGKVGRAKRVGVRGRGEDTGSAGRSGR